MKNEKSKRNKKPSGTGFWLWGLGAVAMGVLGGICILFWYTPRAYQPAETKNAEQVSLYLTHELAPEFHNEVQKGRPFELVISQSGLNDIISEEFHSQDFGDLLFSDPYIIFSEQSILLMGTLAYDGVSSVVSITALPVMNSDGKINFDNRSSFEGDEKVEENVQAIIHNEAFDPMFLFSTEYCEYWVRISKFSIEQGSLKLTLLPEEV
jgi:hypothetical protein